MKPRASGVAIFYMIVSPLGAWAFQSTTNSNVAIAQPTPALPAYETVLEVCSGLPDRPTSVEDLTGGYDVFSQVITEQEAIQLGMLSPDNASRKKKKLVQVHRFIQYTRGYCAVEESRIPVLWAVGVEATLHIREGKKFLGTNKLTTLAAAVELNKAIVTFSLRTLGITGSAVRELLPDAHAMAFDVNNYTVLISAVDSIRRAMGDPTVTVTPQLILERVGLQRCTWSSGQNGG